MPVNLSNTTGLDGDGTEKAERAHIGVPLPQTLVRVPTNQPLPSQASETSRADDESNTLQAQLVPRRN